jgi:hypothetical protein
MSRIPLPRPTLLPGLPRIWRNSTTLQLGLDPARAVLLDLPDPRAGRLLDLLDGSRSERLALAHAESMGLRPEEARQVLDLLHAAGLVVPAQTLFPPAMPDRLTGEAGALAFAATPPLSHLPAGCPPTPPPPERAPSLAAPSARRPGSAPATPDQPLPCNDRSTPAPHAHASTTSDLALAPPTHTSITPDPTTDPPGRTQATSNLTTAVPGRKSTRSDRAPVASSDVSPAASRVVAQPPTVRPDAEPAAESSLTSAPARNTPAGPGPETATAPNPSSKPAPLSAPGADRSSAPRGHSPATPGLPDGAGLAQTQTGHDLTRGHPAFSPNRAPSHTAALPSYALTLASRVDAYPAPAPASPAHTLRRRAAARVVVTGRGRLAAGVAVALAEAGIGHVHPDLPGAVGRHEWPGSPLSADDTGKPRAEAVAAAIIRAAPGTETRTVRRGAASLLVHLGHDQPPALLAISHSSRRQPYLIASIREGKVLVGPLVPPATAPCLNCITLHRHDRDPEWPDVAAAQAHQGTGGTEPCAVATLLAATGFLVGEALAFVDGAVPETVGAEMEISRPGRFRRRSWPPHPACRCTARAPRHSRPPSDVHPASSGTP